MVDYLLLGKNKTCFQTTDSPQACVCVQETQENSTPKLCARHADIESHRGHDHGYQDDSEKDF